MHDIKKLEKAWRVRIVVKLINGNESYIEELSLADAEKEVLRLRMAENKSITGWHFEPVSLAEWKLNRGL